MIIKRFIKIMLVSGVTLVLSAGAIVNYLLAQPAEQVSDLTLANIEAMALSDDKDKEGAGRVDCSGGDVPCADAYDKDGNIIARLKMP